MSADASFCCKHSFFPRQKLRLQKILTLLWLTKIQTSKILDKDKDKDKNQNENDDEDVKADEIWG